MNKYAQGWQSLHAAVHTLAGASDQKQRLESAIIFNLSQINPERDLPPEVRRHFVTFMREMRTHHTRDSEGAVWEVIKLMDSLQRQQAITHIIDFYDAVSRLTGVGEEDGAEYGKQTAAAVPRDFDG
ncbi:MAG TPA: hypothetical protein VNZ68_03675 [Rhodocyclaceae bacterium]|nr:hypothetical protein [Rhodocyclaceae bacterium]